MGSGWIKRNYVLRASFVLVGNLLRMPEKKASKMRKMMKQPAISQFIKKELAPGEDIEDEKSLEKEIRRNGATAYHQCASCAMGPEDDSVLNEKLQVRGIDKLRIADASVMPRIPNAALHAPSMMIGEKAAALIKGEFI